MNVFVAPILSVKYMQLKAHQADTILDHLYVDQHPPYIHMNILNFCKLSFTIVVESLACSDSLQLWMSFNHVWLLMFGVFFTAIGGDAFFAVCFFHIVVF